MADDIRTALMALVSRLWMLPVRDYLQSGEFLRFRDRHQLNDIWREYLRSSQDRPDLYGGDVLKNAFTLFLYHVYHQQKGEFLPLFAGMLADFSRGISCPLPVDGIRSDLLPLGFTVSDIDHALFILRITQEGPPPAGECCPGLKKVVLR